MNIVEIEKGATVTRTEPAKSLGPMPSLFGVPIDRGGDRSYMGDQLVYVGMANGQIYLQRTDERDIKIYGDRLIDVPIDL